MKIILEFPYIGDGYKFFHKGEGRWYISYVNNYGKRCSTAYARYLVSVREGRFLTENEQADHKNDIKDDDRLENLQILTRLENHRKSNPLKRKNVICPTCKIEFLQKRVTRVYCSKTCARQNPEELDKKRLKKVINIPHGTCNGYTYHKCRCSLCSEAKSLYMKLYRDRK